VDDHRPGGGLYAFHQGAHRSARCWP
jgi:hypothetical protein